MLPVAAIWGRAGNDVIPTVLLAALVLPLMFLVLRRARQAGLSQRSEQEDITLALALGFGTVFFFSAVQGKVWFTAHVVGVALALGYIWAAIGAARPILAGIALGLAACTRTPMAFMFPLFALEALRVAGGLPGYRALDVAARRAMHRTLARQLLRFAAPVVVIAIGAMWLNHARFGSPTEFGHTFLDVRQQAQIEKYGLFNYHYLARNLAVAATLLPELSRAAPHVVVGGHGLALWVTTPVLLLLLWPARRGAFHRTLWITVACVAIPTLFYQNSGWVQFGYRFSLDYMPLLILLLAVGDRRFGRTTYALISLGIAINLFGAVTFDRYPQYYRTGGDAYDVVVKH